MNKEQTPTLESKPNEGFHLHRPELLIAAAHGKSVELKRLLLHGEEDASVQVVVHVEEIVEKAAATAIPASEAVTSSGDSVLHVVASSGDGDEFLTCATVIVGRANHLLSAPNRKGDTPLHCAARLRSVRMVSHLLALARARGGTNDDERLKAILRMQNLKGETVLHAAVRLEDMKMVDALLSADPELARVRMNNGASPLYLALSLGHRDIAYHLFEKDEQLPYSGPDGQNAFHAALQWKGGDEIIDILLERNQDLIKQADRSTGRTPLHYAALFGEKGVTELLLEADPAAAYLPDSNGSFPVHLAALNDDQPTNVLAFLLSFPVESSGSSNGSFPASASDATPDTALLQKSDSDSSKGINGGHYCAQLRDGKGRTFLHVAAEAGSFYVVTYACSVQGQLFASAVMNMQDDDGNTALHLAVEVGNIRIVNALVSIPEVKLNLKNNKGQTPRQLASSKVPKERPSTSFSNPPSRISWLLEVAAAWTESPGEENILPREREIHNKQEKEDASQSQSILDRTQIVGLGSVLITTLTFAAAFAMPGGYRADGSPTLAGHYAFNAFVMANTMAFIFSGLSTIFLMVVGLGADSSTFSLLTSVDFLALSARSLGAAFVFGMYAVMAQVKNANNAIVYCAFTFFWLMVVEAEWFFRAVKMAYSDKVVLVKRFGGFAWLILTLAVLGTVMFQFFPYGLIVMYGFI